MNKILHIVTLSMCLCGYASLHAQDAVKILDKTAAIANSKGGCDITFTNNGDQGTLQIKGKKFCLKAQGITTWYDGKTQWTYMSKSEEVNISTPTAAELAQINPQIWLSSYRTAYTAKYTSKSSNTHNISLTPKKKGNIKSIDLAIDSNTNKPTKVVITTDDNKKSTFIINKFNAQSFSDALFKFNKNQYPNADIIDLR